LVQAEMEKKEAIRREAELNQLVKVHNDNIESGRDQFQREVQRKKDTAADETERKKDIQQKVREKEMELEKAKVTNEDVKKKKKKKKVKKSNVVQNVDTNVESQVEEKNIEDKKIDSLEKIRELRQILDEREQVLRDKPMPNDGPVVSQASEDTNVNNSMMYSDKGQDIFDGPESDPWMARKKQEMDGEFKVDRKKGDENNNLDEVIKKIL